MILIYLYFIFYIGGGFVGSLSSMVFEGIGVIEKKKVFLVLFFYCYGSFV